MAHKGGDPAGQPAFNRVVCRRLDRQPETSRPEPHSAVAEDLLSLAVDVQALFPTG
jgi:hypothetical protein